LAVGNRWQPMAIDGNVGNCWYLLAANRCHHFFAVMFDKHHIFAPALAKNYIINPECGIRPKTGSFSENEYEKRRTGDNPNQS
jgi:hypothetical protein